MKYFVKTYGCQMNDADSEVTERPLENEGVADFSLRLEKE
jgi:tRNA A37 methylthiotransferase MiaB